MKNIKTVLLYLFAFCIAVQGYSEDIDRKVIEDHIKNAFYGKEPEKQDAIESLIKIGNPAIPGIIQKIKKSSYSRDKCKTLLNVLIKINTPEVIDGLIAMGADKSRNVRVYARSALGDMGEDIIPRLISAIQTVSSSQETIYSYILSDIGQVSIPYLIDALKCDNEKAKLIYVDVLVKLREYSTTPLVNALQNEDKNIRRYSILALGKMNDKKTLNDIIKAFEDEDPAVRREVVITLGKMKDRSAEETIEKAMNDPDDGVRQAAMLSQAEIFPKKDPVKLMLLDSLEKQKVLCSRILKQLKLKSTRQILNSNIPDKKYTSGFFTSLNNYALQLTEEAVKKFPDIYLDSYEIKVSQFIIDCTNLALNKGYWKNDRFRKNTSDPAVRALQRLIAIYDYINKENIRRDIIGVFVDEGLKDFKRVKY